MKRKKEKNGRKNDRNRRKQDDKSQSAKLDVFQLINPSDKLIQAKITLSSMICTVYAALWVAF